MYDESLREDVRRCGRMYAVGKHSFLERHQSNDIPCKKTQRLVDHAYFVFSSGSEIWSWTQQTMEKIQRRETKILTKLFCLKRRTEETWVDYQIRISIMARKIWAKMKLPFLYEKNCETCVVRDGVGLQ